VKRSSSFVWERNVSLVRIDGVHDRFIELIEARGAFVV
jgi:hypothetical protein